MYFPDSFNAWRKAMLIKDFVNASRISRISQRAINIQRTCFRFRLLAFLRGVPRLHHIRDLVIAIRRFVAWLALFQGPLRFLLQRHLSRSNLASRSIVLRSSHLINITHVTRCEWRLAYSYSMIESHYFPSFRNAHYALSRNLHTHARTHTYTANCVVKRYHSDNGVLSLQCQRYRLYR